MVRSNWSVSLTCTMGVVPKGEGGRDGHADQGMGQFDVTLIKGVASWGPSRHPNAHDWGVGWQGDGVVRDGKLRDFGKEGLESEAI
jgi:hypothetical protein